MSDPKFFEAADRMLLKANYKTKNGYLFKKEEENDANYLPACAVDAVARGYGLSVTALIETLEHED